MSLPSDWKTEGSLLYKMAIPRGTEKLACFDLDSTLIKTKSGNVFPKNGQDWKWNKHFVWNPDPNANAFNLRIEESVKPKLLKLNESARTAIVIFTNQAGFDGKNGDKKLSDFKDKIAAMEEDLGFSLTVYVAGAKDKWRKPNSEMYERVLQLYRSPVKQTIYVGDAAGRTTDFSCSDRKFAANIGATFYTESEYFQGSPPNTEPFSWGFDPRIKTDEPLPTVQPFTQQTLVLMVGLQGSGKSTFAKNHLATLPNTVLVGNDLFNNSKPRCIKATKVALAEGKTVIIDNTNPSRKARKEFIDLAINTGVSKVRIYQMMSSELTAVHNNIIRERNGHKRVPDIAYRVYKKNFEEPVNNEVEELVIEVIKVPFVQEFASETDRENYLVWT